MLAARNGNPQAVKLLVEGGADVNARERLRGTTALMWAASQRHPEAVKAAAGRRRRRGREVGRGRAAPQLHGQPREPARGGGRRRSGGRRAAAAGSTYEEQLALDQKQGRDLGGQRGLAQALGPDGLPLAGRGAAGRVTDTASRSRSGRRGPGRARTWCAAPSGRGAARR